VTTSVLAPLLWTLPWVGPPLIALARSLNSRSLDDVASDPPNPAPLVSVIIPARDGSYPDSWHGMLRRDDDRDVKDGWPL